MVRMINCVTLIIANFLCLISRVTSVCDAGWTNGSSLCYKLFGNSATSYVSALELCRQNDADLLMARTAQENQVVKDVLEIFNVGEAWLGFREISYDTSSDTYTLEWIDGSSVGYTNWKKGTKLNKPCAEIRKIHKGEWRTQDCNLVTNKVVCQRLPTVSFCPDNWIRSYSWELCYRVLDKGTIGVAETRCSSLQDGPGEIVMPKTKRQNNYLNYLSTEFNLDSIHIGLEDGNVVLGSEWTWIDGEKLSDTGFSAWSSGSTPITVFPSSVILANKLWGDYMYQFSQRSAHIVCQCHLLTDVNQSRVQNRAYCPLPAYPNSSPPSTEIHESTLSTEVTTDEQQTSVVSTQIIQTTTLRITSLEPYTCIQECSCNISSEMTIQALNIRLQDIRTNLTVDKTSLSKTIRKLTCAEDPRVSSQYIGYIGAVMISIVFGILVCIDCLSLLI